MSEDRESLESSLRRATLDVLFRIFILASAYMVVVGAIEIALAQLTPWLALEAVAVFVTTALLHSRCTPVTRSSAFVAGTIAISCSALIHFGPLLGTGAIFAVPPVGAALFFGTRRAFL